MFTKLVFLITFCTFYSNSFEGRRTASGERFSQHKLTAAHRTLPFGTCLEVTNVSNGNVVIVKINDRGGTRNHPLDLSLSAFRAIGNPNLGVLKINYKEVKCNEK